MATVETCAVSAHISINVDLEACHLREIRCSCKVQQIYVVKHLVAVEATKHEYPAVSLQSSVVAAGGWWTPRNWPRFEIK